MTSLGAIVGQSTSTGAVVTKLAKKAASVSDDKANAEGGHTRKKKDDLKAGSGNILVCVRVRPFSTKEKNANEKLCVSMPRPTEVQLVDCESDDDEDVDYRIGVDHAFWSFDDSQEMCTQDTLYKTLGTKVLDNIFDGFNCCMFAYGQTGSGKTFSVLGTDDPPENRGLLPRVTENMFIKMDALAKDDCQIDCKVSYLEIYNENIRDLLVGGAEKESQRLEIRTHPKLGSFVQGLSENCVKNYAEVKGLIDFGAKERVVAFTNMNAGSSRSHCVFTVEMDMVTHKDGVKSELRSKLNLVDLAGSERADKTGATGERLKEGAAINQSLSALANVIHKLAENSGKGAKKEHIPFRNSHLTHLLQSSLSGNSKTLMMAAVSPAWSNHDETESTLRFAATCKKVKTAPKKNEESKEAVINDLNAEIDRLKALLSGGNPGGHANHGDIHDLEFIMDNMQKTPQQMAEESRKWQELRRNALEDMGLDMDELTGGFKIDPKTPNLVNISEDPALTGALVYFLEVGTTIIGADKSARRPNITLTGLGIKPYMCEIQNKDNHQLILTSLHAKDGTKLSKRTDGNSGSSPKNSPKDFSTLEQTQVVGRILVNGLSAGFQRELHHHDRIILGHSHCYRLLIPAVGGTSKREELGGEMMDVLGEVVRGDSQEYLEVTAMLESMKDLIGQDNTKQFMDEFNETFPLIEKGNMIMQEIRPEDNLRFQIEVCSEILRYTTDQPEIVVRLKKKLPSVDVHAESGEEILDIFERTQFIEIVGTLEQVYEHWKTDPNAAVRQMRQPGRDPCISYTYQDVASLLAKKDLEILDLQNMILKMGGHRALADIYKDSDHSITFTRNWGDVMRKFKTVAKMMPYTTRARGRFREVAPNQTKPLRGFH